MFGHVFTGVGLMGQKLGRNLPGLGPRFQGFTMPRLGVDFSLERTRSCVEGRYITSWSVQY